MSLFSFFPAISGKEPGTCDIMMSASVGESLKSAPGATRLNQLKYSGYSAEFLDRVEPNGNIPHKQMSGEWVSFWLVVSNFFVF